MKRWTAWLGLTAVASMTVAGCGADTSGTGAAGGAGGAGAGSSGTIECPEAQPGGFDECKKIGQVCAYSGTPSGSEPCTTTYTCDDELKVWRIQDTTCPPDDCLHALEGSYCASAGTACALDGECSGFTQTCTDEHVWSKTHYVGTVPGIVCPCGQQQDEASCMAASGCTWLWPGCDMPSVPALAAAGCYPTAQCQPGWCVDPGTTCQTVSHDPCHGAACDSCGASVSLCLP